MKLVFMFLTVSCALVFAQDTFVCKDGVSYMENDCNRCMCSKGSLGCTFRACFGDHHERLTKCTVGSKFKRSCNDCWCTKDFGTVCTANKC
ncbi:hypothetical protein FQR65_LT06785 [Abscondita terminalis]|nr:hypothetical protein FQR65_LT06785 [Abscondita terminalis]